MKRTIWPCGHSAMQESHVKEIASIGLSSFRPALQIFHKKYVLSPPNPGYGVYLPLAQGRTDEQRRTNDFGSFFIFFAQKFQIWSKVMPLFRQNSFYISPKKLFIPNFAEKLQIFQNLQQREIVGESFSSFSTPGGVCRSNLQKISFQPEKQFSLIPFKIFSPFCG